MAPPKIRLIWLVLVSENWETADSIRKAVAQASAGILLAVYGYSGESAREVLASALAQARLDPRIQPDVVVTDYRADSDELRTAQSDMVFRDLHGLGIPIIRPERFRKWMRAKRRDRKKKGGKPLYPFPLT